MDRRWITALRAALLVTLLSFAAGATPRVTTGLVAYYPFTEGVGVDIGDHAPQGLADPMVTMGKLSWLSGSGLNGIELQGGRIGTPYPPTGPAPNLPVIAALKATGKSTLELWIQTSDLAQHDTDKRIFSLPFFNVRQVDDDLEIKLQHTGKNSSGPWLVTNNAALGTGLTHVVHTFDGSIERLYIDGVAHPTTVSAAGTYTNWNAAGRLAFGSRADVSYGRIYDPSWFGSVRLAAIYDRALTPAEVTQNFTAGAAFPLVSAGPDRATQGLPGQPTQSVALGGSVFGAPSVAASWSVVSGPPAGIVTFDDPSDPATNAHFSANGIYELSLTANNGSALASDRVRVAVNVLSSQITAPENLFPDAAAGVATRPTLEIACEAGATGARFVIAQDPGFTSIVHDSGESSNYTCSYVVTAALQGDALHYWSARVRDAAGLWSDWSTPSQFATAHTASITSLPLQQGVAAYTGASDVDVRGLASDPFNPPRIWNQGAQDVLRTGRRPFRSRENYRSLLRFEIDGIVDPNSVVNAYLELTGYTHEVEGDFFFESDNSFYEMLVPWGEGTGITSSPDPGEATWLHSEYPTTWSFPGAGGIGSDRAAQAMMRGRFTSQVGHKTFWSSQAFLDAVRGWIADPAANHGFLLQADDEVTLQNLNLASKEHVDPTWRPRLVLELIDRLVLTTSGSDFQAGGGTTLVVVVHDAFGNPVADSTTHVMFTPTAGAAISGVVTGTGDGAYGVPGAPEQVAVSAGVVSITVSGTQVGTFSVSFANSAGLPNPAADVIVTEEIADTVLIAHGSPSAVVSRYRAQTGQSEVTLEPIAPSRDVAADAVGNIYTTVEVFVGPGFETDLVRNGTVVDTFAGAPGGLAVDVDDSVLVGHGDASGAVSRYEPSTGQSSPVLALSAPTHDVGVTPSGDIYTTTEVFVGPGFETDLARDGVVVDTFAGAPGGLAVDVSTDTILVGHGSASGVVSRYDPASGLSSPVLTSSGILEDVAVDSTGVIYTASAVPSGLGSDTRLLENGVEADVLPGVPGGLAVVPLPEPGSAALVAGLVLLFALRWRPLRRATARGVP